MFSELAKHGYSRRDTGTMMAFTIIDKLKEASSTGDLQKVEELFVSLAEDLLAKRPASYASVNALRHIGTYLLEQGLEGFTDYLESLRKKYDEDCWGAASIAANRVVDGDVIFTVSNSVCVRRAFKVLVDRGVSFTVYVMESRPGMEGLDMASYLNDLGVQTYLIVDSAARFFIKNAKKALVGAEAIAANGAIVGKIGTSVLSLDASESRVRVFVVAPLYKLSLETLHGELVRLPEADWRMLMSPDVRRGLPENYKARAPLYDVTPPNYIDGIATEIGLFAPQAIPVIIKEIYGSFPPKTRSLEEIVSDIKRKLEV